MPGGVGNAKSGIPEAHGLNFTATPLCGQHRIHCAHALSYHENIVRIGKLQTFHVIEHRNGVLHLGGNCHILLCAIACTVAVKVKPNAGNSIIRQHPCDIIAPAAIRIQPMEQDRHGDLIVMVIGNRQGAAEGIISGLAGNLLLLPLGGAGNLSGRFKLPVAVIGGPRRHGAKRPRQQNRHDQQNGGQSAYVSFLHRHSLSYLFINTEYQGNVDFSSAFLE